MKKLIIVLASALAFSATSCVLVVDAEAKEHSKAICASCGEWSGSDECCDEDAERCGCGMIKGAPGCCK